MLSKQSHGKKYIGWFAIPFPIVVIREGSGNFLRVTAQRPSLCERYNGIFNLQQQQMQTGRIQAQCDILMDCMLTD